MSRNPMKSILRRERAAKAASELAEVRARRKVSAERNAPRSAPPRPSLAIGRLEQSVAAARGQKMDAESAAFMADLAATLSWLHQLEQPNPTKEIQ